MRGNCIYFVEGKCEATLLAALKEHPSKVISGRVKVFNIITNLLPRSQLVTIQPGTTVVFVFDTDVLVTEFLKRISNLSIPIAAKLKSYFCHRL